MKMLNILVNNVITRQQQQIILNIILCQNMKIQNIYVINFYLHATKAGNLNLKVQGQGQINKKCQVKSKNEGIKYP